MDAEIRVDESERRAGDGEIPTFELAPPTAPRGEMSPSTGGRRVPLWAALVGGLTGMLLAFGAGFAVNAGEADNVRDELNAGIESLNQELVTSQASLDAAETRLAECQDAVEGAAAMAAAAQELVSDWEEYGSLATDYEATPIGSPEEAQAEAALAEIDAQVSTKFGALSATATRVAADSKACAAA